MFKTTEVFIGTRLIGYLPYDEEAGSARWPNRGVYGTIPMCEKYTRQANSVYWFADIGFGDKFKYQDKIYTKQSCNNGGNCINRDTGEECLIQKDTIVERYWGR